MHVRDDVRYHIRIDLRYRRKCSTNGLLTCNSFLSNLFVTSRRSCRWSCWKPLEDICYGHGSASCGYRLSPDAIHECSLIYSCKIPDGSTNYGTLTGIVASLHHQPGLAVCRDSAQGGHHWLAATFQLNERPTELRICIYFHRKNM